MGKKVAFKNKLGQLKDRKYRVSLAGLLALTSLLATLTAGNIYNSWIEWEFFVPTTLVGLTLLFFAYHGEELSWTALLAGLTVMLSHYMAWHFAFALAFVLCAVTVLSFLIIQKANKELNDFLIVFLKLVEAK
jgi:hypothetical protein